jgi:hypothetical protein
MLSKTLRLLAVLAAALGASGARALDWSDNAFRYWWGPDFTEPANPSHVGKNVISFTHADGYKWGGNFLNIDLLYSKASSGDVVHGLNSVPSAGAAEFYVVYRHALSLNKITGSTAFSFSPLIRDVNIELGGDFNSKNNAFASRKIMPVGGVVFALNVPGFFNLGVLADKEWNDNAIVGKKVTFDVTALFTAAWSIPVFGPVSLDGFANVNLPKGKDGFGNETKTEVLLHPKAMIDLGSLFGSKGYQVGAGWEYWVNKYGSNANVGAKQSTVFLEAALHL